MSVEPAESELWKRYARDRDCLARDRLVAMYAPWATAVAHQVHRRVWAYSADCEDFIQNAKVGLLEAMSRYDPDRGIPFPAFAKRRIRGAVFNGLKAILADRPTPRDEARFKARLRSLEQTDEGGGDAYDIVVNSILDLGLGFLLEEAAQLHESGRNNDGYAYARSAELEARIAAAVDRLPDRLALIVKAHYYKDLPFLEVAASMGVTKGRVSQLHRTALERLRALLRDIG